MEWKRREDYRESLLTKAAWARDAGFKAAKMEIMIRGPFADFLDCKENNEAIVQLVAASREVIGSTMTMMVDVGYCLSDWKEAVLRCCAAWRSMTCFFFLYTWLQPDDLDGYARLADER